MHVGQCDIRIAVRPKQLCVFIDVISFITFLRLFLVNTVEMCFGNELIHSARPSHSPYNQPMRLLHNDLDTK